MLDDAAKSSGANGEAPRVADIATLLDEANRGAPATS
jgi:hypothetical protein